MWFHNSESKKNVRFDRVSLDQGSDRPSFRFFRKSGLGYVEVAHCAVANKGGRAAYAAASRGGKASDDVFNALSFYERARKGGPR